jgi:hypothetical protein
MSVSRMAQWVVVFCLVTIGSGAMAQGVDTMRLRYGGYLGIDLNLPLANFSQLPTIPSCCPGFTGGFGAGLAVGGIVEIPIARKWMAGVRVGYEDRSATLTATEATTLIAGNEIVDGEFTHTLASTLGYVAASPFVGFRLPKRVTLLMGLTAAIPITAKYDQREEVTQPSDRGTFSNGSRIRNASAGDLPQKNTFDVALFGGISIDVPLSKARTSFISPELTYAMSVTPIVSGVSWSSTMLRLGATVTFSPVPTADVRLPEEPGGRGR